MSEFHPNRTQLVRTKPKLTTRRIVECWPFLVWLGVAMTGYFIYRGGVVFERMNGAVDPYQENITPINEGRLLEIKVNRGDKVPPFSVVAVMDWSKYKLDLESLKRDIVSDRAKDIRDFDLELIKLEGDLRKLQTEDAEDQAIIKELQAVVDEFSKPRPGMNAELQRMLQANPDTQRSRVELAKAKGRNALNAQQQSAVKELVATRQTARESLLKESNLISKLDLAAGNTAQPAAPPSLASELAGLKAWLDEATKVDPVSRTGALRDDEYQKFVEIRTKIEQCQLITPHGGIVDRHGKEVGEFIKPGDGVLKIVGDPAEIVCFLPQDQANDLKLHQKVWVANTANIADIFISEVIGISPRINNLPDATSPLPNRRVHGRDIVVKYPPDALPKNPGEPFKLLPGQTVIVHVKEPGEVPWLDRLFHNDDNDTIR